MTVAAVGARTRRDWIRHARQRLGTIDAGSEARFLVDGALAVLPRRDRRPAPAREAATLLSEATVPPALTAAEESAIGGALARRLAGEPLAYVLGTAAFRGLELSVDPAVLIPRPETEQLVDAVSDLPLGKDAAVLEIGVGSGAISLSLLAEGRFSRIVATDVSAPALRNAGGNATALGLAGRVDLRQGDLFAAIRPGERFDLIVSNPPYVADADRPSLPREVRDHEPGLALFAGDGLRVLRALIRGARGAMVPGGWLALEIGAGQASAVRTALDSAGFDSIRILRDLAGRNRIALASARRNI